MSWELCCYSGGFNFKICLPARKVTGPLLGLSRNGPLKLISWLGGKEFPKIVLHTLGGPLWQESSAVPKIWHRPKEQLRRSKLNCHSSVILNKFSRDEGVRQLIQGIRLSSWPAQNFHWNTNKLKKKKRTKIMSAINATTSRPTS